ncbi:MAG: YceI family protein [Myxococcales bacterium]
MKTLAAAAALAATLVPALASAGPVEWTIDPDHTQIGFRVRHMMVSWTRGHFRRFEGKVLLDEQAPERSRVEVKIDPASIDTAMPKRDEHLRSADFLHVERFPTMSFTSTTVKRAAGGKLKVLGELTLHGVTRPVVLEVQGLGAPTRDLWGGMRRGATARTTLSRKEFGLVWNTALETGGVAVGDEVHVELEVELVKATPGQG